MEAEIDEVVAYWNETYLPKRVVSQAARRRIQAAIEYPLTVADCKLVLDRARDAAGRSRFPALSTVFGSVEQVCVALGLKYVRPVGWLAPFDELWQRHYGAQLPYGVAARCLKPLVDLHGAAEVLRRFEVYCGATSGQFVSLPRFQMTFGTWAQTQPPKPGQRDKRLAADMVEGL